LFLGTFFVPSIYQPRRHRASPLWQLIHHGWDEFLANYETKYRPSLGPLHPAATATVEPFLRRGDLASGFTRLQCPDCGHERLLDWFNRPRNTSNPDSNGIDQRLDWKPETPPR
jgi:hypothetical protein